ncbi:MAG TPA: prepilin peptidase [Candidatus Nitrosotalea sp.]|nr:prepilin peptidase [Candidatus Nitrosotalea sp.]
MVDLLALIWAAVGAALGWGVVLLSAWLERREDIDPLPGPAPRLQRLGPPLLLAPLFLVFALKLGPHPVLAIVSLWLVVLTQILFFDLRHHLILDRVLLPACAAALLLSPVTPHLGWRLALVAGVAAGLFFLLLALLGRIIFRAEAMGLGDVKFVVLIGFILGPLGGFDAIVTGMLLAGLASLVVVVFRLRGLRDSIAYGPFLALGALLALYRFSGA